MKNNTNQNMNPVLIRYIRNRKNQKRGVVVASITSDNKIGIGWSFANTRFDKFSKSTGKSMAFDRADGVISTPTNIPYNIQEMLPYFISRAKRYYKNLTLETRNLTPELIWKAIAIDEERNKRIEMEKLDDTLFLRARKLFRI